jgi:hypothetical protein
MIFSIVSLYVCFVSATPGMQPLIGGGNHPATPKRFGDDCNIGASAGEMDRPMG